MTHGRVDTMFFGAPATGVLDREPNVWLDEETPLPSESDEPTTDPT
jgi:hypothetical protein